MKEETQSQDELLKVRKLLLNYDDFRLEISIELKEGEILSIMGPNGSGKTSLLESLMGIRGGAIVDASYGGFEINRRSSRFNVDTFLFSSDLPYFDRISVEDNLRFFGKLRGIRISENDLDEAMEAAAIITSRKKKYADLSKGMKQRVAIAEVFLSKPKILLVDEPTTGLDAAGVSDIEELISGVTGRNSFVSSVILVTHNLGLIARLSTRVILLSNGKVIASGGINEILSSFRQRYVKVSLLKIDDEKKKEIKRVEGCVFSGLKILVPRSSISRLNEIQIPYEEISQEDIFREVNP